MADKLKTNFQANQKKGRRRPLLWAIVQTFKIEVIIGAVASFVSSMLQVLIPYVVKYIIAFATEDYKAEELGLPRQRIGRGIGLVIGITVMQIFSSMGYNHFFYTGMMVGGQVRSALISMIFDKAMTISGQAKAGTTMEPMPSEVKPGSGEEKKHFRALLDRKRGKDVKEKGPEAWSNGRIVTLMSVDTSRIDRACGWFHMSWSTPLGLVVTTVLLLVNLSYSALVGLGLFFTATPIMTYVVKAMLKRRGKINKDTDQRTSLMQEALQAIRFIKYYAWEDGFLVRLDAVRQREIRGIRYLLSLRNGAVSMGGTIPIFASMLTFITFSLTGHALQPAAVFSSLALFNQLRLPLILFPTIVGMISDAMKALERLEDFLSAEDSAEEDVDETLDDLALEIRDASFTWEQSTPPDPTAGLVKGRKPGGKPGGDKATTAAKETTKGGAGAKFAESAARNARKNERPPFTLNNIDLRVKPNELIAVVGTVGSGKTSLLSALAGEMRRTSGSSKTKGRRAFCTQIAWIQNATIRDNITFGQEFIEEKYDRIIKACSLDHDLQILPHGSFTEIGERGINLSGGQKQRVSLARAIYFDADLVLLDDPLGAVDAHVGEHIMEHAICGLLKDKCRVLVTHQLHFVPRCDRIVIMDKGKAVACDTFENLMVTNAMFQQMMADVNTTKNEKQEEVPEKDEGESLKKTVTRKAAQEGLMKEEERAVHGIPGAVYLDYFRSTGSIFIPPFVLFVLCASQAAQILTSLWLAWWSDDQYGFSTGQYVSYA
jgi:ABC-type multidrug transport system fused ATPase/permease subunit